MDFLLSDAPHFFGTILGGGLLALLGTWLLVAVFARRRPPLIHHSPEQVVEPATKADTGIYLGSVAAPGVAVGETFRYGGPAHITTIGPTRTGKSRRLLIPNLAFETGRSMVVIDIKAELAAITGEWRSRFGKVAYLNPFGLYADDPRYNLKSAGFNPLMALDPASLSFVDDVMSLAEDLIPAEANTQQPHFPQSAQNLLAAVIMFVRLGHGNETGEFAPDTADGRVLASTFGEVRRLLAALPAPYFEKLIGAMVNHPFAPIGAKAAQFENSVGNREIASILSTARTQTAFLDSPAVQADLARDGVDFSSLKRETKTVYLILPPYLLKAHAKWLRLVIDSAMRSLQNDEGLDRPAVLFMLDEFSQLGRMSAVETAVTLAAGYGIKVWAVVQNINQLKTVYKDNWETFVDGGVTTIFQCRDVATPEYMSKLSGSTIIKNRSESSAPSGTSVSEAEQRRSYLIDNHFYTLKLGETYIYEPTANGRVVRFIAAPDLSQLPDITSGAIQLRPAPL